MVQNSRFLLMIAKSSQINGYKHRGLKLVITESGVYRTRAYSCAFLEFDLHFAALHNHTKGEGESFKVRK